jgi:hypothetical protein
VLELCAVEAQNGLTRIAAVDDSPLKRSKTVAVAEREKIRGTRASAEDGNCTGLVSIDSPVSRRVPMGAAEARVGSTSKEEAHNAVAAVAACQEKRRPAASTRAMNPSQDIDRRATTRVFTIKERADDMVVPLSRSQVKSRLTPTEVA